MIMLKAIACSHGVEPVRIGTALAMTKATLRALVYSAMLRTSSGVLKTAAIENPRLIAALIAVMSAQKRNGMLIERRLLPASNPLRAARCPRLPMLAEGSEFDDSASTRWVALLGAKPAKLALPRNADVLPEGDDHAATRFDHRRRRPANEMRQGHD